MPPRHKRRRVEGEASTSEETYEEQVRPVTHLVDDLEDTMKAINKQLPPELSISQGMYKIPRTLLNPGTSVDTVLAQLGFFKEYIQSTLEVVSIQIQETTGKTLSKSTLRRNLLGGKVDLARVISAADELHRALLAKPPPYAYADASVWKDVQTRPRPILCLRPADKHGLPLVLLHQIFSQFQRLSHQPLPNSWAGVNALRVALRLCSRMGDAFDDEKARGRAFDDAMGGFLQGVGSARRLKDNQISGEAERVYRAHGRCMVIREDKVEMGEGGDAYTQVARSYDLACERMDVNGVTPNAPVFLLCVMGPSLTIAGGFKDGDDTVVEPLSPILLMLKDLNNVNGRAIQLASHLLALHTCLEQLSLLPNPASLVPGMPRVFPSFRDAEDPQDTEHTLTFQGRLSTDLLLFNALDENEEEVCVKIVYRPYGEEVQRVLGREGMAPKFLGSSRIDGGPTMIAMEILKDPWQTLYAFAQSNVRWADKSVRLAIRKRLDDIVTKLEGGGFVHGDFRANNIMVQPGKEESAVVIDFDWAGKAGQVHYPLDRNHSGIQWSGEPASAISLGHDRSMLETQWRSLVNPQVP